MKADKSQINSLYAHQKQETMNNNVTEEKIQTDQFDHIGHSLIYHGKYNDKAYLMKLHKEDLEEMPGKLEQLAKDNNYGKILAKIPTWAQPLFQQYGYTQEAYIPGYYNGTENLFFMARYRKEERREVPENPLNTLTNLLYHTNEKTTAKPASELTIKIANVEHVQEMAKLYQTVFETYPFPVSDPAYLQETMLAGKVIYIGAWKKGKLIGMCSAEVDKTNKNAEMTDFAVLAEFRGHNLAQLLLTATEQEMKKQNYRTLYSIARLISPGINKTFIRQGYRFSGILRKNTQIAGSIESMNVYYKNI